jgi:putative ABC transport system substrate-binding protein
MKRREFFVQVGGAMLIWPLAALAQESATKRWRIGSVLVGTPEVVGPLGAVIENQMAALGYQNGRNVDIATRIVTPRPDIVEEAIVALLPDIDVLVIGSTIGGIAAKKVAPAVPTVFHSVGAPVDIGLVQSLAHPGGNMTGIAFEAAAETYGKRLQILKEIVPNAVRVAVLRAPGDGNGQFAMASLERAAPQLGVSLSMFEIASAADIDAAFVDMRRDGIEAVMVVAGALTYSNAKRIADLALAARLASCYPFREAVLAGGLVSLGPDLVDIARRVAAYLDKIMHGAKPADLPVQEPVRLDLYINLRTAAALDLAIPPALLARADEVVE